MDFVSFLGGLALGAAGAALFDAGRGKALLGEPPLPEEEDDPVGVTAGGASGGGGGGGGAHVIGPSVSPMGPGGGGGPHVIGPSVPPIIHDGGGRGFVGDSFFGVSAGPWWGGGWYGYPPYPRRPLRIICRKEPTEDGGETFVCEQPPQPPVAWGPPGWMF